MCRFLSDARIVTPFEWVTRFGTETLLVPVKPTQQRSWNNALYWRWPAAAVSRTLYEWYLSARATSGQPSERLLLDIGANDGLYTYPFAAHGWNCVAFEPQASCVEYIADVCALNDFRSVVTVQAAAGDHSAPSVEFFVSDRSWYSSLDRANVEQFEAARAERVPLVALDDYCAERDLRPTALKIDVEGAELGVLTGASSVLRRHSPDIFIEVASDPENRRAVWELLQQLGYRLYLVAPSQGGLMHRVSGLDEFIDAGTGLPHNDVLAFSDVGLLERLESDFELYEARRGDCPRFRCRTRSNQS